MICKVSFAKQRYFWSRNFSLCLILLIELSNFSWIYWEKGLFLFLDKNPLFRPLCSARHECARGVRGVPQRGAEGTYVAYRLSSLLSKQASTSSLYYYGFQNFPPLLLWLGRKVPFTLSLEACSSTRLSPLFFFSALLLL